MAMEVLGRGQSWLRTKVVRAECGAVSQVGPFRFCENRGLDLTPMIRAHGDVRQDDHHIFAVEGRLPLHPVASQTRDQTGLKRPARRRDCSLRNLTRGAVPHGGHLSSPMAIPPRASFQIRSAAGTRRTSLLDLAPAPTSSPGPFMRRA